MLRCGGFLRVGGWLVSIACAFCRVSGAEETGQPRLDELKKQRVEAAKEAVQIMEQKVEVGKASTLDLYLWLGRLHQAQYDAATPAGRPAVLAARVQAMKDRENRIEELQSLGRLAPQAVVPAQYHRIDAELALAAATSQPETVRVVSRARMEKAQEGLGLASRESRARGFTSPAEGVWYDLFLQAADFASVASDQEALRNILSRSRELALESEKETARQIEVGKAAQADLLGPRMRRIEAEIRLARLDGKPEPLKALLRQKIECASETVRVAALKHQVGNETYDEVMDAHERRFQARIELARADADSSRVLAILKERAKAYADLETEQRKRSEAGFPGQAEVVAARYHRIHAEILLAEAGQK